MLRASILAAGVWLGFLVASWVLATLTFRTADRVAGPEARAEVAERLGPVPAEDRRMVLRHLAAEINRSMFRAWAAFQLVLGGVLVGLAWRLGAASRILAVAALLLAVFQAVGLAGAIAAVGRGLDFHKRPLPPELGRRFGILHGAYAMADLVKAAALAGLELLLLRRP